VRRFVTVLLGVSVLTIPFIGPAATASPSTGRVVPAEHVCRYDRGARCGYVTVPLDRSGRVQGTIRIGYERYPHTDRSQPPLETIVAIEGGPGFPTIQSRFYYVRLFRPLMARHDLLLVDLRGTGASGNIDCEPLQRIGYPYTGWVQAVGKCGRELGAASNLYSTSDAADDLASVLDKLGLPTVDLYGDSYGTFFSQVFAITHPTRLRALVLDAAYPVENDDPWWRDLSDAAASAYRLACRRSPACASVGGDPLQRLARLDALVAKHPISGVAPNADGQFRQVTVNPAVLSAIYVAAGYTFDPYRELDAAVRAALAPHPDDLPLLRLARENLSLGAGGSLQYYSQGLAEAVDCTDYPQLYDMAAPPAVRLSEYRAAIRALEQTDPKAFWPFTIHQWITSPDQDYSDCLRWPAPAFPHPLLPPDHTYPTVPTLVLVGDLDSVTSAEGARTVASRFPDSTFVEVPNEVHVSALTDAGDPVNCAAGIVVRFMTSLSAGDTSCVERDPPVREVHAFAVRAGDLPGSPERRAALVGADTVADVMARWDGMYGGRGVGLRGGTFSVTGTNRRRWELHDVRWVEDVGVTGTVRLRVQQGSVHAVVELSGSGLPHWTLDLRWNAQQTDPQATVLGRLGSKTFRLRILAP
jgi:pimeloyl-ACP methyl ester carboxylesterase